MLVRTVNSAPKPTPGIVGYWSGSTSSCNDSSPAGNNLGNCQDACNLKNLGTISVSPPIGGVSSIYNLSPSSCNGPNPSYNYFQLQSPPPGSSPGSTVTNLPNGDFTVAV